MSLKIVAYALGLLLVEPPEKGQQRIEQEFLFRYADWVLVPPRKTGEAMPKRVFEIDWEEETLYSQQGKKYNNHL